MSKTFNAILTNLAALLLILQFFTFAAAQDIEVSIKISPETPAAAQIEGKFLSSEPRKNSRNLYFLTDYAGVGGIGDRVSNVELRDAAGTVVNSRRFSSGEFVAGGDFKSWRYTVDLTPFKQASAASHISWIKDEVGLLLLDDLLPQGTGEKVSAKVKLVVPPAWKVFTTAQTAASGEYDVGDIEKASFVIGRNLREKQVKANGIRLDLVLSGQWQFDDEEASRMATEIFEHYSKIFGSAPAKNVQFALIKFPGNVSVGNWEGDTRGSSVNIASSDMPFKAQSVQRLHEQLRHEIFHLWFPNGVNLSGNYDWFYEGFALYQSLRLGVASNRIRFADYLDTLSHAYNIDAVSTVRRSLIDASRDRWSGANTQVYARGILVAFLCDLSLLEASKGKTSTDDLVREIYQKYRDMIQPTDGSTAVIDVMTSHPELRPIVEHYVRGADKIEWATLLDGAGLEAATDNSFTVLRVIAKPGGRQRDLLDKLGYNNWRKLSANSSKK